MHHIAVATIFSWSLIFVNPQKSTNAGDVSLIPSAILPNTGYYCYVRCTAKCIEEHKSPSLESNPCSNQCNAYNNDHICDATDKTCWARCHDLVTETGPSPETPQNAVVAYSIFPYTTPHEADLRWEKVSNANLYLVQYTDKTDGFQKSPVLNGKLTISNEWHFDKPDLCPEYAFRVAAVNKFGISPFSGSVILPTPVPTVDNASYSIASIELMNKSFVGLNADDPTFNSTVRILINYTAPSGWKIGDDIVRVDPTFHLNEIPTASGQAMAPYVTPLDGKPQVEILLPGDFAYTTSRTAAIFQITRMYTKCNPLKEIDYPAGNQLFPVIFNCDNVAGATCPGKRISPACNLIGTTKPSFECANGTVANTTMEFSINAKTWTNAAILYYVIKYAAVKRRTDGPLTPISAPFINETTVRIPGDASSFPMSEVHVGNYYETSICAVYDNSTENDIHWNIVLRFPVDLTGSNAHFCDYKKAPDNRNFAWISIPLATVLLLACVIVTVLYVKTRRHHTKTLSELASLNKTGNPDGYDNGYIDIPRSYDRWEIPKANLLVYEDKKLGSGAFGAVYKGKIKGRALMNTWAQSPLAEHWMKTEDCEVAVKMLPEYADEGAKSEFRKEINLMKQLGHHDRLVNMLCCLTADEPLCLVVEFCNDGDLLHYLRDRCKYMVKLQEQGIDLNNLPQDSDVDLNYILTMKDLLQFSWQISVGLEYLSEKNYIHRDVAARNIMVDTGKRAKIGDFGLCRYSCSDPIYMGKGGRLPWKWMALEAIKNYEFTSKSDVWSFGVLLFEIVTLGGSPYPGIDPSTMEKYLESGNRLAQPDNCPDDFYAIMIDCWVADPEKRPTFCQLKERLSKQLEHLAEGYQYLYLNQSRDYYNMYNNRQYPSNFGALTQDDDFDSPSSSNAIFGTEIAPRSFENPAFDLDLDSSSGHQNVSKSCSSPMPQNPDIKNTKSGGPLLFRKDSIRSDQMLISPSNEAPIFKYNSGSMVNEVLEGKPVINRIDTLPEPVSLSCDAIRQESMEMSNRHLIKQISLSNPDLHTDKELIS